MGKTNQIHPLVIRDCALTTMTTGMRAQSLRELRLGLRHVHHDSIYHHFWGRLLQPQFDDPEYSNDFAHWVSRALKEKELAERMAVISPLAFPDIESLREEMVDLIDEKLDESDYFPWAKVDQQFYFLRSQIIVFDTDRQLDAPKELSQTIRRMTLSSLYYHFIDARRRNANNSDDFSQWLSQWGDHYDPIIKILRNLDPCFSSLKGLQLRLIDLLNQAEEDVK